MTRVQVDRPRIAMAHPRTFDIQLLIRRVTVGWRWGVVTLQTLREDPHCSFSHPLTATIVGNYLPWKAPSHSTPPNLETSTDCKVALRGWNSSVQPQDWPLRDWSHYLSPNKGEEKCRCPQDAGWPHSWGLADTNTLSRVWRQKGGITSYAMSHDSLNQILPPCGSASTLTNFIK